MTGQIIFKADIEKYVFSHGYEYEEIEIGEEFEVLLLSVSGNPEWVNTSLQPTRLPGSNLPGFKAECRYYLDGFNGIQINGLFYRKETT